MGRATKPNLIKWPFSHKECSKIFCLYNCSHSYPWELLTIELNEIEMSFYLKQDVFARYTLQKDSIKFAQKNFLMFAIWALNWDLNSTYNIVVDFSKFLYLH